MVSNCVWVFRVFLPKFYIMINKYYKFLFKKC